MTAVTPRRRPGGRLGSSCPGSVRRSEHGRHRHPAAVLAVRLSPGQIPSPEPNAAQRPPWCGECDQATPMLDYHGDAPRPCPRCKSPARQATSCTRDGARPHCRKQANAVSSDSFNARSCRCEQAAHGCIPMRCSAGSFAVGNSAREILAATRLCAVARSPNICFSLAPKAWRYTSAGRELWVSRLPDAVISGAPGRATGEPLCIQGGRPTSRPPALRASHSRACPPAYGRHCCLSRAAAIPRKRAARSRTGRSPGPQGVLDAVTREPDNARGRKGGAPDHMASCQPDSRPDQLALDRETKRCSFCMAFPIVDRACANAAYRGVLAHCGRWQDAAWPANWDLPQRGSKSQAPWAVLLPALGTGLDVAAGDYRGLLDGMTGGDGPGEADVLCVRPGQWCSGESASSRGKTWLACGREIVPDLLGEQVAVVAGGGHRGQAAER
jgi:hypothetical protein